MKKQIGFSIILIVFLVGYGLGLMTTIAGWSGKQFIDESIWIIESLPYFSFVLS